MSDAAGKSRVRDWLCRQALPLWLPTDCFAERLTAEGAPDNAAPRRSLVQARQIYVYSHAALLGLMPEGKEAARKGFDFLLRHGAPDGGANGFVHALDAQGRVLDASRDLYDQAFLLLAFGWFYRASGDKRALQAIDDVRQAIARLRHPSGLGYLENDKGALPRRQNPHMHLLEGLLAAHEATGRADLLEEAGGMVALFHHHFLDGDMLREYFDDELRPDPARLIVEPGHHHEWVWLLSRYAKASGQDMTAPMRALYDSALRHGAEPGTGLLYNEIWSDGRVKDAAKRLWPQSEQLKAEAALGLPAASATVDRIFRYFLEPAPPGAWVDRLDASNAPIRAAIPASSLYHLFLAFAEYLGVQTP